MWQVYLYLANEHQDRQRDARARARGRRWPFGRRDRHTIARSTADAHGTASSSSRTN